MSTGCARNLFTAAGTPNPSKSASFRTAVTSVRRAATDQTTVTPQQRLRVRLNGGPSSPARSSGAVTDSSPSKRTSRRLQNASDGSSLSQSGVESMEVDLRSVSATESELGEVSKGLTSDGCAVNGSGIRKSGDQFVRGQSPVAVNREADDPSLTDILRFSSTVCEDRRDGYETLAAFRPRHFLRCHSRAGRGAPADIGTHVGDCQFEPGGSDCFATCGGNVVCFVSASSGQLLRRFTDDDHRLERFSVLSWSRLLLEADAGRRISVLAVGGCRGHISLFHPDYLTRYCRFRISQTAVSALAFHESPTLSRWLFCGAAGMRAVMVWDVGAPAPPHYAVTPQLLVRVSTERDVNTLLLGARHLLAGTAADLYIWRLDPDAIRAGRAPVDPVGFETTDEGAVEALAWLPDNKLAIKMAGLDPVLVWRFKDLIDDDLNDPFDVEHAQLPCDEGRCDLMPGMSTRGRLLVCGDNRGAVWMYDVGASSVRHRLLAWPRLLDEGLASAGKMPPKANTICVNRVAVSADGRHVVACTEINMVCVWSR